MDVTITEDEEEGTLLIESAERDHTLLNLLRKSVWEAGGEAGYDKGHPSFGSSTLVIRGEDVSAAREQLEAAVERAREDLDAFADAFEAAV